MKVYIASHDRWAALYIAGEMERAGHQIVSRWLRQSFEPTEVYANKDKERIAEEDAEDVANCEMLILVAGRERYPGGKFVECGIALGLAKEIVVLGHRENMLMWHPRIRCIDNLAELL